MPRQQDLMVDEMIDHLNVVRFEGEAKTYLETRGIKIESIPHGEIDHEARTIDFRLHIPR